MLSRRKRLSEPDVNGEENSKEESNEKEPLERVKSILFCFVLGIEVLFPCSQSP